MHKSAFLFLTNERNSTKDSKKFPVTQELLSRAGELNLDSVFVQDFCINAELLEAIKDSLSEVSIYGSVTVFSKQKDEDLPKDALAVEVAGKTIPGEDYAGICPMHKGMRAKALENVRRLAELGVDGVWLDALRYPSVWSKSEPVILDTCYCPRCLEKFEEHIGEPIEGANLEEKYLHIDGSYYHEWLEFKSKVITSFVEEARKIIDSVSTNIKLGYFAIPWQDKEYGAGIKRIVAQDFAKLAELTDFFSPMLYHKMLGKDVAWIQEMIEYFWQVGAPYLPLVQTEPLVEQITSKEFKKALEYSVEKPSSGVCLFYLDDLALQPELFNTAKEFFASK